MSVSLVLTPQGSIMPFTEGELGNRVRHEEEKTMGSTPRMTGMMNSSDLLNKE